jgi:hypothetical protein
VCNRSRDNEWKPFMECQNDGMTKGNTICPQPFHGGGIKWPLVYKHKPGYSAENQTWNLWHDSPSFYLLGLIKDFKIPHKPEVSKMAMYLTLP